MNPTQTHKVFGQSVRSMLAVAIAASAVSTASVKAGPTEDTIAAAMNATGIGGGTWTAKNIKVKDQNPNSTLNQAMIASFTITFGTPTPGSVAGKITASKLFAFYQKGLPEYSPNLAELAVKAALNQVNNTLKYKDAKAQAKDAAKIASFAVKNGMKAYKSGTRNSSWTGFTSQTGSVIEANIGNIAYQTNAAIAGKTLELRTQALTEITKSLVKATSKFKKFTTNGPSSVVTGFIAQVGVGRTAGVVNQDISENALYVITSAVKNAKKDFISVVQAAAYAGYNAYKQAVLADGGTPITAAAWAAANQQAIFAAFAAGYGKKAPDFTNDINQAIATGAATTTVTGAATYLSSGGLFSTTDGEPAPTTVIKNS